MLHFTLFVLFMFCFRNNLDLWIDRCSSEMYCAYICLFVIFHMDHTIISSIIKIMAILRIVLILIFQMNTNTMPLDVKFWTLSL